MYVHTVMLTREEASVCTHNDATDNETSVTFLLVQYPSLVYTTLQGNITVVLAGVVFLSEKLTSPAHWGAKCTNIIMCLFWKLVPHLKLNVLAGS